MSATQQSRTIPCGRCRSLHVECQWSEDKATCIRCTQDQAECSGPQRKPRSTRPPCDSCRRKRTRCVWVQGEAMCLRCQDRGLGVCPIPPRSITSMMKSDPVQARQTVRQAASHAPINLMVRNNTWDEILTDNMRENLTSQGRVRLSAAGFACLPKFADHFRETETSLDGFLSMVFAISGLKFSNVTSDPGTKYQPTVQLFDTVTTTHWLANPAPKASFIKRGLGYLYPGSWKAIKQLVSLIPLEGYNLQRMLSGMQIYLRLAVVPQDEIDTIRMVLACLVMATAIEIRKSELSPDRSKDYANIALKFIVREHHYSVTQGQASVISPDAYDEILSKVLETTSITSLGDPGPVSTSSPDDATTSSVDSILRENANQIITSTETTVIGLSKDITTLEPVRIPWIRDQLNQLYTSIDTLSLLANDQDASHNTKTDSFVTQLRKLELQVVELSVMTTIAATRHAILGTVELQQYLVNVAGEMALESLQRIIQLLRVILAQESRLVDVYPIVDAVTYVLDLGKECLPPYMQRLSLADATLIIQCLKIGLFWGCRATTLVSIYSTSMPVA